VSRQWHAGGVGSDVARPRLCIVSEALARSHDEGIKNLARAFVREAATRCEVLAFSTREAIPEWGVERFRGNRLFLNPALWRPMRRFRPDAVLYIPWTSATSPSIARAWVMARAARAPVGLVATQPQPYRRVEMPFVRWLRPSVTFVQGPDNGRLLSALGHNVAFLPSGVDLAGFAPVTGDARRAARRALDLPGEAWVAAHVGHLNRQRVDAALFGRIQTLPGVQAVVVGSVDRPQDADLVAELEGAGVKVVRRYLERVAQVYEASDCYLFPVRAQRNAIGVPLSLLEAMACNLPVVTTPFEGLVEMFAGGGAGLVFADGRDALVEAVRKTRGDGAAVATRAMVEPFGWQGVVERAIDRLFESLPAGRRPQDVSQGEP
jgi:glycosyltransferase involved in cell wall biosynthesis